MALLSDGNISLVRNRSYQGQEIRVPLDWLRPTQMTVGMRAVVSKRRKIENRADSRKALEKVLSNRPIPAVHGPGGHLFIIDHHHFGLALWQAEIKVAYARIIDDMSHLCASQFWRHMEANGRLYPYDETGRRVNPRQLPPWLHALRHDPYRDLAWEVREAGGFTKSREPYAEFRWANFFRDRIAVDALTRAPETALRKALRLCRSSAATSLPGFIRHS